MKLPPMHMTLYLDESGGKDFPPPFGKGQYSHYVQVGVALTPQQDILAQEHVVALVEKHFSGQLGRPQELHYGDLINGRNVYRDWTKEKKQKLADDVFDSMLEIKPVLYGTVIQTMWLQQRYRMPDNPVVLAMRATIDRFHKDLVRDNSTAMVFIDEDRTKNDAHLAALVMDARRRGIKMWGQTFEPMPERDSTLPRIINSIVTFPSHMSPGIQLADFVAYAVFSKYERGGSRRFDQLAHLWKKVGSFQEPALFPGKAPTNPVR